MKWLPLAVLGVNFFFTNGEYQPVNFSRETLSVGDFVDTESCYSAIEESVDSDGDRRMDPEAYVDFVKAYGPDNILDDNITFEELPLLLVNNFYLLACLCKTEDEDDCCVGPKAGIDSNGAFSGDSPTEAEKVYLFLVCSQTNTAIDRLIQSLSPTEVPIPTIQKDVVVNYTIGVETNDSTFEDYEEELISAMDSMAPTLLAEVRQRQLRAGRNLQSVFLPTTIIDHTMIGKSNNPMLNQNTFCADVILVWSCSIPFSSFFHNVTVSLSLSQNVLTISLNLYLDAKTSQPLSFSCFNLRMKNPTSKPKSFKIICRLQFLVVLYKNFLKVKLYTSLTLTRLNLVMEIQVAIQLRVLLRALLSASRFWRQ